VSSRRNPTRSGRSRGALAASCASVALALACAAITGPKPAWEEPPPPPTEAPVVQPGTFHRARLDNGLEILVLEDRRLPRVALGIEFRRGEGALPPEQAGLASFTTELLERGAGSRDALEFAEYVDSIGASFSAAAAWDSATVGVVGLSEDLDRLMEILRDAVRSPRFEKAEADRARAERLAALERALDDPATLASWHTAKAVYGDHRYGLPVVGSPDAVQGFDESSAREYHRRTFIPNDAIFFASGDVSADDIVARVKRAFGDWEPGPEVPAGPAPPPETPAARKIVIVDRPDLVQAQITLAHEGIRRTADDRLAVSLMNSVVGGSGFSSRLMAVLRSEAGLTYGIYSGFDLRRQPGPFIVATSTRVPEVRNALDLILDELRRARRDPPDASELTWARTLAVGRFSMGLETSAAVMSGLVDLEVHGLPDDSLDTFRTRIRAVSAEQVSQAARDHLHPDRAAIVLVGPADQILPLVEDLGPVEVVQP
jgi:zinc protease